MDGWRMEAGQNGLNFARGGRAKFIRGEAKFVGRVTSARSSVDSKQAGLEEAGYRRVLELLRVFNDRARKLSASTLRWTTSFQLKIGRISGTYTLAQVMAENKRLDARCSMRTNLFLSLARRNSACALARKKVWNRPLNVVRSTREVLRAGAQPEITARMLWDLISHRS
jgi:hypothetical protein